MEFTYTKEALIYHLNWLMKMASKQFPNGLLEEENEQTYEIMKIINNFPNHLYKVPVKKIGDINNFKQYIRRLDGKE